VRSYQELQKLYKRIACQQVGALHEHATASCLEVASLCCVCMVCSCLPCHRVHVTRWVNGSISRFSIFARRNEAGSGRVYTGSAWVIQQPNMWRMFLHYRWHVWLSAWMSESISLVMSHLHCRYSANKRACTRCIGPNDMIATSGWLITTLWKLGHDLWWYLQTLVCSTGMLWTADSWMTTCQIHSENTCSSSCHYCVFYSLLGWPKNRLHSCVE
jgi:hypothetical protein